MLGIDAHQVGGLAVPAYARSLDDTGIHGQRSPRISLLEQNVPDAED